MSVMFFDTGGAGKFRVRRCRVVGEVDLAGLGLDTPDKEAGQ